MPHSTARRDPADCLHCATRSTCLLAHLPDADLQELQPLIRKRSFRRGDVLAHEGTLGDHVCVVKVGSVFGYRRGLDGQSRPIGIAGRGANFGLFGVFRQPPQASGIAASSGRVCEIPLDALRRQAHNNRAFSDYLSSAAVQSCGRIAAWSEAMRVRGVPNQLAYSLLLLAEAQGSSIVELPTHTALAELLGTTRETVVRAFGTLEKEEAIRRLERKKCEIRREALITRLNPPVH